MVSLASGVRPAAAEPLSFTTNVPVSSTNSFAQQLLSALQSFTQQSGSGSKFQISVQPAGGQNSGGGQYIVTVSAPTSNSAVTPTAPTAASVAPASAAAVPGTLSQPKVSPQTTPATNDVTSSGFPLPTLQTMMTNLSQDWSMFTPTEVAYQLANNTGTRGNDPASTVPGTTMTFGDLTQAQMVAYEYGTTYGTGGQSMQDFLTANVGPNTAWNISYNQIQANPDIQTGANIQSAQSGSFGSSSLGVDNLPNAALIQYLPAGQQAAAYAAIAAEGAYGQNAAAAAEAYSLA